MVSHLDRIENDVDRLEGEEDRAVFADVYSKVCSQFDSRSHVAGNNPVTFVRVNQNTHAKEMPGVPDIVFRLVTESKLTHNSVDIGDGRVSLSGKKSSFYLAPANADATWESEGEHQILMLAVPEKRVRDILAFSGLSGTDDPLRSLYGRELYSAVIPNMMENIWRESLSENVGSSLFVDGLFMTLLGEVARLSTENAELKHKGDVKPLDQKRLTSVTEYIDANLGKQMSIEELAGVACLSVFHFGRCFKAATNTTPHAFVTARRLEAARAMLSDCDLPLAEVAYACGFSSQAHFTSKFRDYMGITPGAYRDSL